MTGALAKAIWESAVEPARRESAKMRAHEIGAAFRYAGMLDTLRAVRLALIVAVTREEGGVLAEISSEFIAMEKAVPAETCPRCKVGLVDGKALVSSVVAHEDFGGDAGAEGATRSIGGPGRLMAVRKCPECGYSVMSGAEAEYPPMWATQPDGSRVLVVPGERPAGGVEA